MQRGNTAPAFGARAGGASGRGAALPESAPVDPATGRSALTAASTPGEVTGYVPTPVTEHMAANTSRPPANTGKLAKKQSSGGLFACCMSAPATLDEPANVHASNEAGTSTKGGLEGSRTGAEADSSDPSTHGVDSSYAGSANKSSSVVRNVVCSCVCRAVVACVASR